MVSIRELEWRVVGSLAPFLHTSKEGALLLSYGLLMLSGSVAILALGLQGGRCDVCSIHMGVSATSLPS